MSDSDLNQVELEPGWHMGPACGYGKQNSAPPKGVYTLIPRTREHVTFHGQRDLAEVMKLRILRWVNPGLSRGPSVISRSQCHKMGAGRSEPRRDWTRLHFWL